MMIGQTRLQVYNVQAFRRGGQELQHHHLIFKQFQFFKVNQLENQKINTDLTQSSTLAVSCEFREHEEQFILLHIVLGIRDKMLLE